MPQFYFHLINDVDVPDIEGQIFADLAAARIHAVKQARAMVAAMVVEEGRIVLHHRIDIEDEQHDVLDSVPFRDAVKIEA